MNKETGGPAFPATEVNGGTDGIGCKDGIWHYKGMTLRDWLAGMAMQAILARTDSRFSTTLEFVGGKAYQYADAMIKAREE